MTLNQTERLTGRGKKGDLCTTPVGSGYDDIAEGTTVVVKNEKGTLIATGKLGQGGLSTDYNGIGSPGWQDVGCTFPFTVTGVPKASIYTVTVSNRGEQTYSADDLTAKNWNVELSLGTPTAP